MSYAAFQTLVAPARRSAPLWRLVVGISLVVAIYFLCLSAWFFAEMFLGAAVSSGLGRSPVSVVGLLFSFVCIYPGLWLAVRILHRRPLRTLFGPAAALRRDAGRTILAALCVFVLALALPGPGTPEIVPNLPFDRWLGWLPLGLVALAVQITAEELVFRGYIQSQLAARFNSPWVWMVLPAVTFGALHYNPAEAGANAIWMLVPAVLFGIVAADLTARAGNLGPALALHLLNNFASIFILAPGDMMSGLALWRMPVSVSDPVILEQLPTEALVLFILWLTVRLAIRK